MGNVLVAIARGIQSQLQPRMLALLVVPFVVAMAFWVLSAYWMWDPVTNWFASALFEGDGWIARAYQWSAGHGMAGLKRWIPDIFAFLLIVPLAIASALALISLVSMPAVIRFLGNSDYKDVERRGSMAIAHSAWNVARAMAIFIVGYIVTIPLWFIPPLALVVPWLWWGWLTSQMMRFDSLVEHATPAERNHLILHDRTEYMTLGLAAAALNYIPPLFIIAPVLSALVFSHYSLRRLRELRASGEFVEGGFVDGSQRLEGGTAVGTVTRPLPSSSRPSSGPSAASVARVADL